MARSREGLGRSEGLLETGCAQLDRGLGGSKDRRGRGRRGKRRRSRGGSRDGVLGLVEGDDRRERAVEFEGDSFLELFLDKNLDGLLDATNAVRLCGLGDLDAQVSELLLHHFQSVFQCHIALVIIVAQDRKVVLLLFVCFLCQFVFSLLVLMKEREDNLVDRVAEDGVKVHQHLVEGQESGDERGYGPEINGRDRVDDECSGSHQTL